MHLFVQQVIRLCTRVASVNAWVIGMKIGVTFLCVMIVNRSITIQDTTILLHSIDAGKLAAVLLTGCAGLLVQAERWYRIMCFAHVKTSRLTAYYTFFWGTTLAFVTPARAGELGRGLGVFSHDKATIAVAVAGEKLYAGFVTLALGAVSCGIGWLQFGLNNRVVAMVFYGIVLAAIVSGVFLVGFLPRLAPRFSNRSVNVLQTIPLPASRTGHAILAWSLAAHVILLSETALLIRMFTPATIPDALCVAGAAYALMALLPFAVANIGVREFSFGFFLAGFSLPVFETPETRRIALGVSMGILFVNLAMPAVLGALWSFLFRGSPDSPSS